MVTEGAGDPETIHQLGILDIFGFECFEKNSFEQLCINYANEKLQQHFNAHMIALEKNEYEYELGADAVANIHFEDSSRCLELFESVNIAQPSIFKLIDEQGGLGSNGSDVNLLRRLEQTFITPKSNPHIMKASQFDTQQFKISHYAGEVIYDVEGFTEKNKDALSDTLTQTLQSTNHPLMQILFPQLQKTIQRRGTKIGGFSLASQFCVSLNALIQTINDSVPRYVRCIKPNKMGSSDPADLDQESVKGQLRAGSILEAVRIRKIGYGYRMEYSDFGDQFWPIYGDRLYEGADRKIVEEIFTKAAALNDENEAKILAIGED